MEDTLFVSLMTVRWIGFSGNCNRFGLACDRSRLCVSSNQALEIAIRDRDFNHFHGSIAFLCIRSTTVGYTLRQEDDDDTNLDFAVLDNHS